MGLIINIKTDFLNDKMIIPEYAHEGDAGVDLQANIESPVSLSFGERTLIKTGIFLELPEAGIQLDEFTYRSVDYVWEVQIRPRSGLAYKHGITVTNSPGTIDSGYRGEIGVILHNLGKFKYIIHPGDKIAQAVLARAYKMSFNACSQLNDTDRGAGGYNSTGS